MQKKKNQLRLISMCITLIMLLYMNVSGQDLVVSGTNLSANVSSNGYNLPHVKHAQKTVNYTYNNGNYDEYRSISLTRQQVNARTERSSIVLSNENITNHNTPDRRFYGSSIGNCKSNILINNN